MTLTQLTYFCEVVRLSSFTKAANKLFISQSTLSKSIKALEDEYQVALINRGAKTFELTKEGQLLFEYAERILNYYDAQITEFEGQLKDAKNVIKIGIPLSGELYCKSYIAKMQMQYPEIQLELYDSSSKQIYEDVLNGKLDAGFTLDTFEDERIDKRVVVESEILLVVPQNHMLSKKRSISFRETHKERFLMLDPSYDYYSMVVDKCRSVGFEPEFVFQSNHLPIIIEMVAHGHGVTFLPQITMKQFNSAKVHQVHLKDPEFQWRFIAIRLKDKLVTTPMKKFWSVLSEEIN